ncbi:hypothetical protein [Congregibacter sp.]|uniref:hypothetical protein n=1 Tax=Congregibacter sp. TaxID=2744308 RepID=UPI003F6B5F90
MNAHVLREQLTVIQMIERWKKFSCGQGVSDMLFGDFDFQGRLSFAWPQDAASTNDLSQAPLFPMGFGLKMQGDG